MHYFYQNRVLYKFINIFIKPVNLYELNAFTPSHILISIIFDFKQEHFTSQSILLTFDFRLNTFMQFVIDTVRMIKFPRKLVKTLLQLTVELSSINYVN